MSLTLAPDSDPIVCLSIWLRRFTYQWERLAASQCIRLESEIEILGTIGMPRTLVRLIVHSPLTILLSLPLVGIAQEETEVEEEDVVEEVIVTGSRVISSALDSPSPVTVYDADVLIETGITTVEDFARYLPQNADNFSDTETGTSPLRGSAGFNLRGIGLDGTLTLVNGRRVAPFGASGDFAPFVDINAIPVAAIDRIEVLKDGASAIYGSEAVAGVVNIITRKQVNGFTIEGGYLGNNEGDGDEWDVAATGGWSNASTSITATLSYYSRERIMSRDRDYSKDVDFSAVGGPNARSSGGSPPTITAFDAGFNFVFRLPDPECGTNPDISNTEFFAPNFGTCRFNYQYFTTQQQPSDRLGLTARLDHFFDSGLELFAEVLYSDNETSSTLAPTPLFNYLALASHPNNPFADIPEAQFLLLRTRVLDAGNRDLLTEATTWRALAGLRGEVSAWDWETAIMRSVGESGSTRINAILENEFQEALFGMAGPNGDLYYNPFGFSPQNSQEAIEHFRVSGLGETRTNTETTLDLQLNRSFGNLGGGPIATAFGLQFRQQEVEQTADDLVRNGLLASGGSFDPIEADRDISSAYAEALIPILDSFEVQLAARYDDYSDFGSTTNPKIGLGWRPAPEVLIRATWGTSFRPPTFRNLYDPAVERFGAIVDDFRCPVTNDPQDCFGRDLLYSFRGNPQLQPDEGENALLGVAWQPAFAPGLTLQLDYWQIEHTDRILRSSEFPLGDALFDQLDPLTNPFIIREPQTEEDLALGIPGIIVEVRDTYVNGGKIDTSGFDFDASWVIDTAAGNGWSTALSYSYLKEYRFGSDFLGISADEDLAGRYGFISGLPEHRANLRLGWHREAHGVSAFVAYAGEFDSYLNLYVDGRETDTPFVIDSYTQLDLQYSYRFQGLNDAMVRVGCRNCTNQDPPQHNASVATAPFHEGRGLIWYLRWSQPLGN